jgi:aminoglycoside phosphotransferase (APT) family kinase protein
VEPAPRDRPADDLGGEAPFPPSPASDPTLAADPRGPLEAAFPGAEILTVEPLAGGRMNATYKAVVSGRPHPYVVRMHLRGEETARREWEIARLVHGRVPIPEIVWTGASGGVPASVQHFVEGTSLAEVLARGNDNDCRQAARATGEALAAIGGFTFRAAGFLGPGLEVTEPHGPPSAMRRFIADCLFKGGAAERLGEALAARVVNFVQRTAHRLDRLRDTKCLVHADFNVHHVLLRRVSNAWTVAAVLDWEFAFSGIPLWDVGSMLRRADALRPDFAEPFARAFAERGGELPQDWRALSRLLDLMNLMEFLTRPNAPAEVYDEAIAWTAASMAAAETEVR